MRDLGWERGPDRSPLFDVMVALDRLDGAAEPDGARTKGGVSFVTRELPRRSKAADRQFVFIRSAHGLELALTYNDEIFGAERAQGFLERLWSILDAMIDDRPVVEILKGEGTASE
jgi:hypothetical protein